MFSPIGGKFSANKSRFEIFKKLIPDFRARDWHTSK